MPQARINFTAPTERVGDTPLSLQDISYFVVQRKPASGSTWANVGNFDRGEDIVVTIEEDAYDYRASAVDTGLRPSAWSNTIQVAGAANAPTVQPPKPPVLDTVTYL